MMSNGNSEAKGMEGETMTATIEGLDELKARIRAEQDDSESFSQAVYNDGNGMSPLLDGPTAKELRAKYPIAAAHVLASKYWFASDRTKNKAGRRALDRIEAGEDHELAIADMKSDAQGAHKREITHINAG